jgi:hypothetical protein
MAVSIHAMTVEQSTMAQMAREVNELFVIPASTDKLLAPILELVPNVPPLFAQAAEAFCSNVRSVVSTAGVPYVFALAAAHVRRINCSTALLNLRRSSLSLRQDQNLPSIQRRLPVWMRNGEFES